MNARAELYLLHQMPKRAINRYETNSWTPVIKFCMYRINLKFCFHESTSGRQGSDTSASVHGMLPAWNYFISAGAIAY